MGVLICLDGALNIVMDKVEEHRDGKLISKYNKLFLRGNNVLHITTKAARTKSTDKATSSTTG